MFIALDGIDGAGKSTQIELLTRWLDDQGEQVISLRDPGSTATGEAIREILLDSQLQMHRRCEALLYMAARSQLVEERIRPALAEGKTVVSDRFLLANVVYQSVGKAVDADLLWRLGEIATASLRPDLTILLDLPAGEAVKRQQEPPDRVESRGQAYMEQVRRAFLVHLPAASPQTVVINASQSVASMHTAIVQQVQRVRQAHLQQTRDPG